MKAFYLFFMFLSFQAYAAEDISKALRRAQYLLNATVPTDQEYQNHAQDVQSYRNAIRGFLDHNNFYEAVLRYHELQLGVGLPTDYIDELLRSDIDHKTSKFATIECGVEDSRLECQWAGNTSNETSTCPASAEQASSVFWYPGLVAWVCPSVIRACGSDLSRCFIRYRDSAAAQHSEIGTTEAFDSRFSVIKSLGKQSAGLATAVVVANYPYTKILEPGLYAVDGAIAHFYRQSHHFDLAKLNLSPNLISQVEKISLTNTRYRLIYDGGQYEQAGILSSFGWLRRYEKNRTRANQLYERLLCRQFTAELPRVFPQDPGNLRTTPGCEGCHSVLDPLADFFTTWGEGGDLYSGVHEGVETSFAGKSGRYLSDLSKIIREDPAFASCTVEHVWEWLIGRKFHETEEDLRTSLTKYFMGTNYSFKELAYVVATHPVFLEGSREDTDVIDPLAPQPLGEPPGSRELAVCEGSVDFATQIAAPAAEYCQGCHNGQGTTIPLISENDFRTYGKASVLQVSGGFMPLNSSGAPFSGPLFDFKESIRCWVEEQGL
ncbi:MAG: hypothetical protein AB8C84_05295 [Oligoflexales bacterium]